MSKTHDINQLSVGIVAELRKLDIERLADEPYRDIFRALNTAWETINDWVEGDPYHDAYPDFGDVGMPSYDVGLNG